MAVREGGSSKQEKVQTSAMLKRDCFFYKPIKEVVLVYIVHLAVFYVFDKK